MFFLDITSSLTSWHDWGSVNLFLKKFINKKIKEGEERKAANSWSCTDGAQFHKKNALKLLLVGVFEMFDLDSNPSNCMCNCYLRTFFTVE